MTRKKTSQQISQLKVGGPVGGKISSWQTIGVYDRGLPEYLKVFLKLDNKEMVGYGKAYCKCF